MLWRRRPRLRHSSPVPVVEDGKDVEPHGTMWQRFLVGKDVATWPFGRSCGGRGRPPHALTRERQYRVNKKGRCLCVDVGIAAPAPPAPYSSRVAHAHSPISPPRSAGVLACDNSCMRLRGEMEGWGASWRILWRARTPAPQQSRNLPCALLWDCGAGVPAIISPAERQRPAHFPFRGAQAYNLYVVAQASPPAIMPAWACSGRGKDGAPHGGYCGGRGRPPHALTRERQYRVNKRGRCLCVDVGIAAPAPPAHFPSAWRRRPRLRQFRACPCGGGLKAEEPGAFWEDGRTESLMAKCVRDAFWARCGGRGRPPHAWMLDCSAGPAPPPPPHLPPYALLWDCGAGRH